MEVKYQSRLNEYARYNCENFSLQEEKKEKGTEKECDGWWNTGYDPNY